MDHTIVHFEIPAKNAVELGKFYSQLFDWKIIHSPVEGMDYWIIQTVPTDENGMPQRPGVNGGLFEKQPGQERMNAVNYIAIENIDEHLNKVTDLGGKILVPKQEVPTVGFIAVVIDPDGNQFGLLQPAMK
ncbi:MAG: VOC family protein [Candidatus Bathyarchaeota archaeon]|jgi:predicted enzyme related to lactoylglutathione lyase